MRIIDQAELFANKKTIGSENYKNENEGVNKGDPAKYDVYVEGDFIISKHSTDNRDI